MEPTKIQNFDANNVTFSAIKKNRNGGKFVSLSNGASTMYVQLPALRAPFGVNHPDDKIKDYYLNLSLTDEIAAKFSGLDERVLKFVSENSVALLNKQVSVDVMRDVLFTPTVKPSKDGKYQPTLKLKASTREGKEPAQVFNAKREEASLDDIEKGSQVESIIELNQIWFINGKFGVSLRLNQAKLAASNKLKGYAFVDSSPTNSVADEDELDVPEDE
jgi:hypothetical protein